MRITGESLTQNRLKNQPDNKPKNNQGYSHTEDLVTVFFWKGVQRGFWKFSIFVLLLIRGKIV